MAGESNRQDREAYARRMERDGFATIDGVVNASAVEDLRRAVAAIPIDDEGVRRKRRTYAIRNVLERCPAVRELVVSEALRGLVVPILGEAGFAVRALYFDKTPDANWKLAWHQDNVIAVQERALVSGFNVWSRKAGVWHVQPPADFLAKMLTVRVHLDDCDPENGPLRVLPGSHAEGWLDDRIDAWKKRVAPCVCSVRAGGAVVMRPLILHASSASARPGHRRVLHIEYACEDLPEGLTWATALRFQSNV